MKRFAIVFMLLLGACSRHDNLPPMLVLPAGDPPTPVFFPVSTTDSITFDLDWTVSDPSNVSHFRVYTIIPLFGIPLQIIEDTTPGETSSMSKTTTPIPGVPVTDVTFGVSSVTTGNIESTIVFRGL